jgi:hypothetical protein
MDHQPDFSDVSLAPVDYDPFGADGAIQQAPTQLESQPQRLAAGVGLPHLAARSIPTQGLSAFLLLTVNVLADKEKDNGGKFTKKFQDS